MYVRRRNHFVELVGTRWLFNDNLFQASRGGSVRNREQAFEIQSNCGEVEYNDQLYFVQLQCSYSRMDLTSVIISSKYSQRKKGRIAQRLRQKLICAAQAFMQLSYNASGGAHSPQATRLSLGRGRVGGPVKRRLGELKAIG